MGWFIGIGIIIILFIIGVCSDSPYFIYRKRYGEWRAYFLGRPPSYTHVLHDEKGYYVCWDRPVYSQAEVRQIAREWVRLYG